MKFNCGANSVFADIPHFDADCRAWCCGLSAQLCRSRLTELVIESGAELPFVTKMLIFISGVVKIGFSAVHIRNTALHILVPPQQQKIELPLGERCPR